MAKKKGGKQRPYYYSTRPSPRQQYDDFIRSPKADDPSEGIITVDLESESGQAPPITLARGYLVSYVPPAEPSKSVTTIHDISKTIGWIVGIAILIGGLLWSAFSISHDVKDVKNSLSDIKNNEIKTIHDKLEKQEDILEKLLQEQRIEKLLQEKNKSQTKN